MSLRRKIALWLCPELDGPVVEPVVPVPHAPHKAELLRSLDEWEMELDANDRLLNARLAAARASIEARALMNKINS